MTYPREVIPEHIRVGMHKRFPKHPRWFPPVPETPWSLIEDVLAQGRRDGLNNRQLAGGVYTLLVARGLLSEGRA
ncbi:hypothetical protein AFCDBAGC_0084 [Methylobacterium cerastii]|uniref:Transposase n=1 Tax=Methylobacterium cerastii TaxID=932741 RepID=A0ABQ4QAY7_9HYPH|nr:hypothetical protein [Methylobacterium cerastii]GJD42249.1 hypothetical protein AFCDBAGC_0084 [Methylobacterium cerastii]